MGSNSVTAFSIVKVTSPVNGNQPTSFGETEDLLAVEEPLEIRIVYGPESNRQQKNISVTMCTPGNDIELATGFLFTEGIITHKEDIRNCSSPGDNILVAELQPGISFDPQKLERHFYTSSSCGVCGKTSIGLVKNIIKPKAINDSLQVTADVINSLPGSLRKQQKVFEHTGGLHASALFDLNGGLLLTREDVGRHNALDKLIGVSLQSGRVPLDQHILLLSGRASFELIQKAAMAGIKIVCAVGAPSSLAVEMAKESGITLIGFLRDGRFNIYSGQQRINK
ncbi:MAG TPA: formate dehydrogenase accessory sulfurtransferase FdhD [Chitinophagaceae bacterium]|nr:formate dehydrogenase accessory sulfurtransferase FdhD [Chitinophagaceae bacterium]